MRGQMKINPVCSNCKTRETPLWRKGPNNTYNCNACGLYYRIYKKDRPFQHKSVTYRQRKRLKKGAEEDEESTVNSAGSEEANPSAFKQKGSLASKGHRENGHERDPNWNQLVDIDVASKNKDLGAHIDVFLETHEEENKNTVERKHYMARVKETKAERKVDRHRAEGAEAHGGTRPSPKEAFGAYPRKERYVYDYSYEIYDKMAPPCSFNVYPSNGYFKVSRSHASPYMDSERGIQFPEIKLVPREVARGDSRERRCVLNDEEMEAAEALADFAYYARHRG